MGKKKRKQKLQVPVSKEGIQTDVQPQRIEAMPEELKQKDYYWKEEKKENV